MKIFTNKLVENGKFIRFLEIFPGSVSWSIIFLPIYFAITNPYVVMYFIIIYDSYWFFRSLNISRITLISYRKLKQAEKIDWPSRMKQTENLGDTLKSLLANKYITEDPIEFSDLKVAQSFITDGLRLAFSDESVTEHELLWLKETAKANGLDENWFNERVKLYKETPSKSSISEYALYSII